MDARHELSRGWRGGRWGKRLADDWAAPPPEPAAPQRWRPLVLTVVLGVALGAAIAQGLARQDRARLDALMDAVEGE